MSDTSLTRGSYGMWLKKLIPKYNFYIYDTHANKFSEGDIKNINEYMKYKNIRFVVSNKKLKIV